MKAKKHLVYLLILFLSNSITATYGQSIKVIKDNGTETSIVISDIQKVSFSGTDIIFNKTNLTQENFAFANIQQLIFIDDTLSVLPPVINNDTKKNLLIYPNPVTSILNLQCPSDDQKKIIVQIISTEGHIVLQKIWHKPISNTFYQIDVSMLPEGIYICILDDGEETASSQFKKTTLY